MSASRHGDRLERSADSAGLVQTAVASFDDGRSTDRRLMTAAVGHMATFATAGNQSNRTRRPCTPGQGYCFCMLVLCSGRERGGRRGGEGRRSVYTIQSCARPPVLPPDVEMHCRWSFCQGKRSYAVRRCVTFGGCWSVSCSLGWWYLSCGMCLAV